MAPPRRGEIWIVALDPTKGSEIKKTRPCLVISRNDYNRAAQTVTVIPISSGEATYSLWQVQLGNDEGLFKKSYLRLPQIRAAAKERFHKRIGKIRDALWLEIQEKLYFYLGFEPFSFENN